MHQNLQGCKPALGSTSAKRTLFTTLGVGLIGVICSVPGVANAQHCKLHYAEAFQLVSVQSFKGQTPAMIKQTVDNLFGPRQEVCGEGGYKFFLSELGTQASEALRKKGADQESRLIATREIMNRFPLRVRFSAGADPAAGLVQLRSDLGVLSTEVGVNPSVQGLLDALAKITPPKNQPKPLPKDDDAIPVVVPKVPLPAWAIISLYEIRDHASRKEDAAIAAKTNLILDWVGRSNPSKPPAALQVPSPPPAK